MKKYITIIMFLSYFMAVGQKKEIKKAEKLYESGDIQEASELLISNETLFNNADEKTLLRKTYLEAKIDQKNSKYQSSYEKYQKYKSSGGNDPEFDNIISNFTNELVSSAIEDTKENRYSDAVSKLYLAYTVNPEINQSYLYYAASYAVRYDFDTALKYYLMLNDLKYEGIETNYFVTSVETDEEIQVDEAQFKIYEKTKDYKNFREETTESLYPQIVGNIAIIYAKNGDNEKAMEFVKSARELDPENLNLILTEADLYIKLDEKEKYYQLMEKAIKKDPNNPRLYFNLGVINEQMDKRVEAASYYEKAIEVDPTFESSYLNLVALKLQDEKSILDEMNGLGRSNADNRRYDELLKIKENLYRECIPILSKLVEISKNQDAIKQLMNIYGSLQDTENFKKMKSLLQ